MASNGIPFTRAEVGGISLPVGFRFHPTEEELIGHYLQLKLQEDSDVSKIIGEINICEFEPGELPEKSLTKSDEEWYFYNRPIYKKNSRKDRERATSKGFWKITAQDKPVNKTIGNKRILTFYQGRGRNAKITPWVMHEFYIPANQTDLVLCHVKKKSGKNTDVATGGEGESSNCNNAPDFENQPQRAHNMDVEEEHNERPQNTDIFQMHKDSMLGNEPEKIYSDAEIAMADGFFTDPYVDRSEEITHPNVLNDCTLPESPRKVYLEAYRVSSGSVTEVQFQGAKEAEERRAAVDSPMKRNFITESNKDTEAVQGNYTEKGLKQKHNAITAGNWMSCSFISWETSPPLTSPPSVYLFNTVLGVILFFVFAREVVLYGQWC